ncbi:MAG: peptidase M61, partial [Arenimonas sp.]
MRWQNAASAPGALAGNPSMASYFSAALFLVATASAATAGAQSPPISDSPYPGTLSVSVDATDIARRIFTVHEEIAVSAGPLRLFYPQWLPGNHGPRGPIDQIGGLMFRVGDTSLNWRRDPLDMYSFLLEIPARASKLQVDFQFLSPLDANQGRVVVTPEIIGLQWNTVLLYPAGHAARAISVQPEVTLPDGWKFASALEVASQSGARIEFKPVDLETLVDSPVLAGKYFRRFELAGSGALPVHLDVVADAPKQLEAKPEVLARHVKLVDQAYRLFGAPHYRHYDFLLSVSARYASIGLEHHQSSEDGVDLGYLIEPKEFFGRDLLPHEFTHSWNGKFRRGADLATANFNTPMQDSLLWVYEGQTQYWGNVLAARAGLHSAEQARETLAVVAATYANREGRVWRSLQDTTNQPIISARRPQAWRSWQRPEDYYSEGQLIWLDADTLIREKSVGARSLDDFARGFFGVKSDRIAPLPYVLEDVVAALNTVLPYDWSGFLRERLDGKRPEAPLDGLSRGGWKLVYDDKPNLAISAAEGKRKYL